MDPKLVDFLYLMALCCALPTTTYTLVGIAGWREGVREKADKLRIERMADPLYRQALEELHQEFPADLKD